MKIQALQGVGARRGFLGNVHGRDHSARGKVVPGPAAGAETIRGWSVRDSTRAGKGDLSSELTLARGATASPDLQDLTSGHSFSKRAFGTVS